MAAPAPLVSIFFSTVALFDGNASVTTGASATCATGSLFTGSGSACAGRGSACGGPTAAVPIRARARAFGRGGGVSTLLGATALGVAGDGRRLMTLVPSARALV